MQQRATTRRRPMGLLLDVTHMPTWAITLILLAFAHAFSLAKWHRRSRGLPLPPGPKPWPLIGNIIHMRKPQPWRAHQELCRQYGECSCGMPLTQRFRSHRSRGDAGELTYLSVMGQSIAILGSPRVLSELLDKRSAVTSDHPQSVLIPLYVRNLDKYCTPLTALVAPVKAATSP